MRVLLDEDVPHKLKYRLAPEHEAITVPEHGWAGMLNGDLLRSAEKDFDAFITMDRGIEYQQNLDDINLRVVLIRAQSNKYEDLLPLVPSIHDALERARPGEFARVSG